MRSVIFSKKPKEPQKSSSPILRIYIPIRLLNEWTRGRRMRGSGANETEWNWSIDEVESFDGLIISSSSGFVAMISPGLRVFSILNGETCRD